MDLRFHPRTEAQKELRFVPRRQGDGWPGYVPARPEPEPGPYNWLDPFCTMIQLPRRIPARARGIVNFSLAYGISPTGRLPSGPVPMSIGCQVVHDEVLVPVSMSNQLVGVVDSIHSTFHPKWDVRTLHATVKKLWDQFTAEPEPLPLPKRLVWDEGSGHILD